MTEVSTQLALRIRSQLQGLREGEDGQSMVEYGLLLAGIAIIVIAAVLLLGDNIANLFEETANSLDPVGG